MKEVDLIVIGGGPAGMTAATEAARLGATVALIEENENLGGKVFAPTGHTIKGSAADEIDYIRRRLRKSDSLPGVDASRCVFGGRVKYAG
jgi:flavin-dependent dehydrogenase